MKSYIECAVYYCHNKDVWYCSACGDRFCGDHFDHMCCDWAD